MLQAKTVERLLAEFGECVDRRVITEVVSRCAAQLWGQGAPGPALPELVEQLARTELADLGAAAARIQPD